MLPPKPASELKDLDYFVGTWRWDGEIRPNSTGGDGKMTMIERNAWMEGGFFLILSSEFQTPLGNGVGTAYMGYDVARGVYTYDEFNSMGEAQHSTGTFDGYMWTWLGEQNLGESKTKTRLSMNIISSRSFEFIFETSHDGESWTTVMHGKATKSE